MVVHSDFNPKSIGWVNALPQLERMATRYPEYFPYGIGDVEQALVNGEYMLIEFPDAFLIVEEDRDYLHAVVAAGYTGVVPDFADYSAQVYRMAINAGFQGFKFTTPRLGWQKRAIESGFKVLATEVTYIYEA